VGRAGKKAAWWALVFPQLRVPQCQFEEGIGWESMAGGDGEGGWEVWRGVGHEQELASAHTLGTLSAPSATVNGEIHTPALHP
jgi:hypothetical protein